MVLSTSLRLAVLIFAELAVVSSSWIEQGFSDNRCYDVAIVGGGVGGTYTAWRLRNQGLKVAVFESTDRIGGRTFSMSFPSAPNVPLDVGAMRFIPGVHTSLERTLHDLGLTTTIFQPDQFEKLYYVRRQRLRLEDFDTDKNPYNLAPGESKDPDVLSWRFAQQALNVSEPDKIDDIEDVSTPDGVPLYKQGFLSIFENIWSTEAKAYLKQRNNFRVYFEPNMNAVHYTVPSNPNKPHVDKRTVVGGMNRVATTLARRFLAASTSHSIKLNRRVDKIVKFRRRGKFFYRLKIYRTKTVQGYTSDETTYPVAVCASKVILAFASSSLPNIQWQPLEDNDLVLESFKAVTEFSAMKLFLAYPFAWWDTLPPNPARAFETDNPLRQGGEFGRFRNSSGHETAVLMACYTDGETNVDYWRELRKFPSAFPFSNTPEAFSVSERVLTHAHSHLGAVYGIDRSKIPRPLDGVMTIWDEDTNIAWQNFNPGYKPKTVERLMRRPVPEEDVFIVTNSFSRDYSTWVEGSLRAAESVLSDFFNLS